MERSGSLRGIRYGIRIAVFFMTAAAGVRAAEDFTELSLADLLNMEVTTVSRHAERASDAPGVVSVVTRDELERFGGTTLRDVLERVPGLISAGANYTNRTTIAVRGDQIKQNSSHVLILINGRPVREVQEGGVSSDVLETFPVAVIDRIEVVKGPGSVLYGSDAFSGVINIITETAREDGVSVTGLGAPGGGYWADAGVTVKRGDLSVVGAGRYLVKDEWETPFVSQTWTPVSTPPYYAPKETTVTLHLPNEGYGVYLGASYKGLNLMSAANQWTTKYVSGIACDIVELRKYFLNLGYALQPMECWHMDYNITYTHSELFGRNISERSCHNLVAEMTHAVTLGEDIKLTVGGLYNKNEGREENMVEGFPAYRVGDVLSKGDVNGFALYSQLDYHWLNSLKLIGGLQANKVEKITLDIVPRAGIVWYPVERFTVKALYSEAFRAPSINEVNMDFQGVISGNPDLEPEDVATVDLSVSYLGERAQASVNVFRSRMTDIIQLVWDPDIFASRYENRADVTYQGAEFEGKWYITQDLLLTGSALYQTNEDDSVKNLAPIANMGLKAGISYVWPGGITVGLFDIYQGDLDERFTGTLNAHQGAYNLLHLHSTFDLSALLHLRLRPALSLVFDIDNLLDEEHFIYDLGGTTGDGIPAVPGRAVYVGLNAAL